MTLNSLTKKLNSLWTVIMKSTMAYIIPHFGVSLALSEDSSSDAVIPKYPKGLLCIWVWFVNVAENPGTTNESTRFRICSRGQTPNLHGIGNLGAWDMPQHAQNSRHVLKKLLFALLETLISKWSQLSSLPHLWDKHCGTMRNHLLHMNELYIHNVYENLWTSHPAGYECLKNAHK